jgi:DNA repair exonuclease SbcCD ATPase subunit
MSDPVVTSASVEFLRFRLTNAGHFKAIDLDLHKRGLVRMTGRNGEGKSTIWHMFTQAAYATSPNKGKKADLDYLAEEPVDMLLEMTFKRNGSTYVAAQAVKSKTLGPHGKKYASGVYLFRDGIDISLHKDPDTQKLIRQTLGWTLEEWYGYVYLAQSSTHALINGTRSERQTYLTALFNLMALDTLAGHFSKKASDLGDELEELERDRAVLASKFALLGSRTLDSLQGRLTDADADLEALTAQLVKLQATQEKFNRKNTLLFDLERFPELVISSEIEVRLTTLRNLQAEHYAREKQFQTLQAQLSALGVQTAPDIPADYEEVLAGPDIDYLAVSAELGRLQVLSKELQTRPVAEVVEEIPADFAEVLASPSINYTATTARIKKIKTRPAPPQVARVTPEQLSAQREKIQTLTSDIAVMNAEIRPLQFNQPQCSQCGTVLDCADRQGKLEEKQAELEGLRAVLTKSKSVLVEIEQRDQLWRDHDALGPDLSGELPELEASVALYEKKKQYESLQADKLRREEFEAEVKLISQIPALEEKIQRHQLKERYKKLTIQRDRYRTYEVEKLRVEKALAELPVTQSQSAEIVSLQAEFNEAKRKEAMEVELISLKAVTDQSTKIANAQGAISELQGIKGSVLREIEEVKDLNTSIQKFQQIIAEKEQQASLQKLYSILAKGYGKAGQLRERQVARFSRYLENALLAHTIRQFPSHRFKIVVDDGVDIMASKNGGKFYDVCFMSGAEKGDLSVAFLFALDDLLPPDRRSSLKVVDEVEGAFDKERKKDFVEYTLPRLRARADTVVVISHSAETDSGKFNVEWELKGGQVIEKKGEAREFELAKAE